MQAGCRWRVGDGNSIHVWYDKWLPRLYTFQPITVPPAQVRDMVVGDLINADNASWKVELIRDIFRKEDANLIFSMRLARTTCPIFLYGTIQVMRVGSAATVSTLMKISSDVS